MEIPNLSQSNPTEVPVKIFSFPAVIIILTLAVTSGFFVSRFFPSSGNASAIIKSSSNKAASADSITNQEQITVGKLYGNTSKDFGDSAKGTIQKGNINGVGTHILERDGGVSQRVSLTSSTVDLDLFVGLKVEVKGQTNSSNKTGWLLDVGSIKRLE